MKNAKLAALLLAVLMLLPAAGCGTAPAAQTDTQTEAPTQTAEVYAVTLTDMAGRTVELERPAERIVALAAADCEILFALGAGDRLVGRGEYCDYPENVLSIESVQSGYETNIEQILALAPDVVVLSKMAQTVEQNEALENAGVRVVVSDAQDVDGVYTCIEMLGTLTGLSDRASALAEEMRSAFGEISASAENDGKTVYFEVSPLEWGLWTAGSGTFMNEIAQMLGLKNVFDDVEGWAEVDQEQIIERDPDYIVTITERVDGMPDPAEEILGRSGWENITAVKNGMVFTADSDEMSVPGPRLVDAARSMRELICGKK